MPAAASGDQAGSSATSCEDPGCRWSAITRRPSRTASRTAASRRRRSRRRPPRSPSPRRCRSACRTTAPAQAEAVGAGRLAAAGRTVRRRVLPDRAHSWRAGPVPDRICRATRCVHRWMRQRGTIRPGRPSPPAPGQRHRHRRRPQRPRSGRSTRTSHRHQIVDAPAQTVRTWPARRHPDRGKVHAARIGDGRVSATIERQAAPSQPLRISSASRACSAPRAQPIPMVLLSDAPIGSRRRISAWR